MAVKIFDHGIQTEEDMTDRLERIYSIASPGSLEELSTLREASLPMLDALMADLINKTGLMSERSLKSDEAALEKVRRAETLQKYPWFELCHLRDYLRFRTHLTNLDDFGRVLRVFQGWQKEKSISIVKVDTSKLLRPGLFGWRMVAMDIRFVETGMIIEHYMSFSDLIHINQDWLHRIYEHWRKQDMRLATTGMSRAFHRDREFCKLANREIFLRRASSTIKDGKDLQSLHRQNLSNFYENVRAHLS